MFASINILNENGTTETAHARHFSDNFRGILHVTIMQGQTLRKETKDLMLSPQTGIYKELPETLLKNTYTPIEWEGFTPCHAKQ